METNADTDQPIDLAGRLFEKFWFKISWIIFLALMLTFVGWPIRNVVLVCWVYGTEGYFRDGIRVLRGKPTRFSDGELAPTLPDLVTGFGIFIVTAFGLTLLLIFALRTYEKCFKKRPLNAA